MKSTIASVLIAFVLAGVAYSQSLGDVARENRRVQKKKAARVYTNDDIPSVEMKPAGPVAPDARYGSATENKEGDASSAAASAAQSGEEKKDSAAKPTDSAKQAKNGSADYKSQIEEQQKAIDLLQRELNVSQRELEMQTAIFYSDAGTRLRNPKDWTDKQKSYQESLDSKQKALADAKAKLDGIMEESRKAGTTAESSAKPEDKDKAESKDK
jgi:hypothetical protein